MSIDQKKLVEDTLELGAVNATVVDVEKILFSDEVRKYCEMNSCGKYGKNWACPPGVGPVSELKARAGRYKKGLMVQTVHQLKNSFDLKGMMAGGVEHEKVLRNVLQMTKDKYELTDQLLLGAGNCTICETCSYVDDEPCRFPEDALASLEAYGIDVMKLTKDYGVPYHNGTGTVSYVGLILF
jgi:predicted metal-binding protein